MNRSDINEYDMVRALYEYSRVGDYNIHIRVSALLQRTPLLTIVSLTSSAGKGLWKSCD